MRSEIELQLNHTIDGLNDLRRLCLKARKLYQRGQNSFQETESYRVGMKAVERNEKLTQALYDEIHAGLERAETLFLALMGVKILPEIFKQVGWLQQPKTEWPDITQVGGAPTFQLYRWFRFLPAPETDGQARVFEAILEMMRG